MANRKINELVTRTPSLSDLILVGDPSSGYSYKATVTALATIIETDIADGFVTISTTQTISGAKTFSNNLTLTSVANAATTQTKFLTLNASNVVNYRTGAEVLADIGGQAALTNPITGTGTTNYLPKFTSSTTIGNSQLIDNGTTVFLGTSGTLPNVKMIISTTSQRALELNSTSGNALFVSSGGAFVMTVTNGTWSSQFTQAGRLELGGDLSITTIANATVDTDKFLVSDSGVLKYRTGAEVLSDIGGASSASISGTTNYIPKFTSSSAIGNSVIQENSGNIGIGTSPITPSNSYRYLHIEGGNSTSGGVLYLSTSSNTNSSQIYSDISGLNINTNTSLPIIFNPAGTEQMRLTSTGLGIGTSSPAYKLDVNGNAHIGTGDSRLIIGDVASANTESVIWLRTGSGKYAYSIAAQSLADESLTIARSTTQGGTTFSTASLTLNSSGNLGLGTSSPVSIGSYRTLTIQGGSTSNGGLIQLQNSDASVSAYWFSTNTASTLKTVTNHQLIFGANNTDYLYLSTSGNLGLGVTPSASTIPTLQFGANAIITSANSSYLLANAVFNSGFKYVTSSVQATQYQQTNGSHVWYNAPSGTAGNAISFTQAMTLDASGRLGIGTTSPTYPLTVVSNSSTQGFRLAGRSSDNIANMSFTSNDQATEYAFFNTGATYFALGTNGSERMRITSGGNVLIGTTTDGGQKFQVNGTGYFNGDVTTTSNFVLPASGILTAQSSSATIYIHAGATYPGGTIESVGGTAGSNPGTLIFRSGTGTGLQSERMRITSAGNVGIGTTSPATTLHVAQDNGAITLTRAAGTYGTKIVQDNTSGQILYQIGLATAGTWRSYMRIGEGESNPSLSLQPDGGNVGIGTTSPGGKLHVAGDGAAANLIRLQHTGTGTNGFFDISVTSTEAQLNANYSSTAIPMTFLTGASERMRITSAGRVLIGTTTDVGSPFNLQVDGRILQTGTEFMFSGDNDKNITVYSNRALNLRTNDATRMTITSGGDVLIAKTSVSYSTVGVAFEALGTISATRSSDFSAVFNRNTTDGGVVQFRKDNVAVGSISVTGSATAYNTSSDYRLKQDLKNFNGLNLVDSIKVYDYQWKADSTRSYGVMAHELQSVLPYAVTGVKDGEMMQGVDYSKIVPILIKSIQQLKAEIETLKNK